MSGASGGSTHAPARCLYAALNVPRDASATDIKKAYRKEALVWHPDKNVGNAAEAHVRFQELQHAYAVLSDPQERRWYDDHRDEILHPERYARGDDDSDDDGGRGRTVNLTKYFSATVFSGFGDDESGFYQTYSRAFQEIWDAEKEWGDSDALSGGGEHWWGKGEAPDLGGSRDSFEMADAFYCKWSGFVSGLSFGWEDEYNLSEADSRRVRRLMEKENNKKRAAARRKYHDDVRALVDFCRRRDKRVIKHRLQLAKEKEARERKRREKVEAQKVETERRRLEWLRNRQAEEEAEEEARARDGETAVFRVGETDDEEDVEANEAGGRRRKGRRRKGGKHAKGSKGRDEDTLTVFRCAVCKKDFKSKGQMANHETSKAHRKKMEELDAQMIRESLLEGHGSEVEVEGDGDGDGGGDDDGGSSRGELEGEQDGVGDGEDVDEDDRGGVKGKRADDFEADDFFMEDALRELHLEMELERQGLPAPGGAESMPSVESSIGPSMEPDVEQEGDDKLWGEADVSIDAFLSAGRRNTHGLDEEGPAARPGLGDSRMKRDGGSDTSTSDDDSDDDDSDDDDGIGVLAARTGNAGAYTEGSDDEDDEDDEDALEGPRDARVVDAARAQWDVRKPRGKPNASRRNPCVRVAEDSDDSDHGDDRDRGVIDLNQGSKRGLAKERKQHREADPALFGGDDDSGRGGGINDVASVGRGARRRRRQVLKAARATGQEQSRKGKRGGANGEQHGGSGSAGGEEKRMNCRVCGKNFPSRTKLFAHVKAEGHGTQT